MEPSVMAVALDKVIVKMLESGSELWALQLWVMALALNKAEQIGHTNLVYYSHKI